MTDLSTLSAAWMVAKEEERRAIEIRRSIEDAMLSLIGVPETLDRTENAEAPGGYTIRLTGRISRTVNGDLLQSIAAESGLTEHLSTLFRWKPEINAKAWNAADASITHALSGAITAKPGRVSFSITQDQDSE